MLVVTLADDTFLPNSSHPLVPSKRCHGLESEHSRLEPRRNISDSDHDRGHQRIVCVLQGLGVLGSSTRSSVESSTGLCSPYWTSGLGYGRYQGLQGLVGTYVLMFSSDAL